MCKTMRMTFKNTGILSKKRVKNDVFTYKNVRIVYEKRESGDEKRTKRPVFSGFLGPLTARWQFAGFTLQIFFVRKVS